MPHDALYIEIYKEIKNLILSGKIKDGEMLPTEKELSLKYYTSRITIQNAMSKLVDEKYIKRIPGRGTFVTYSSIATHNTDIAFIGVILCNMGSSFGTELFMAIEKQATEYGFSVVFKNTYDDAALEEKAIDDLINLGVKGIIIQPVHGEFHNERIIRLQLNKFPIVLVDRHLSGFPITSVMTDNIKAAEEATEYLFSMNHNNIAFVSFDPKNTSSIDDRINGFKSAFIKNKKLITADNLLTNIKSPAKIDSPEIWSEDIQNIKAYLSENPRISAILACELTVAELVFTAVNELGKTIPKDYSFVMFDGTNTLLSKKITHIKQDQSMMGKIACDLLIKKLNNEIVSDKVLIPHQLILNETVTTNDRNPK